MENTIKHLITCGICLECYNLNEKSPMALPCQHQVCLKCLHDLHERQKNLNKRRINVDKTKPTLICPFDNCEILIDLNMIQKNRTIIELLEANGIKTSSELPSQQSKSIVTISKIPAKSWDQSEYLRDQFNAVDINGDGHISLVELKKALKNGQDSSMFDTKTACLLFKKYDKNGDGEISFNEFEKLFIELNMDYLSFVATDNDGNEIIDETELQNFFELYGYKFEKTFYNFILNGIEERLDGGITFDVYERLMLCIERLHTDYNDLDVKKKQTLEEYIKTNFFKVF